MQFLITVSEVGRSRFAYGAFNPPVDVLLDHGTEFDCPLNDGGGDGYFWGRPLQCREYRPLGFLTGKPMPSKL